MDVAPYRGIRPRTMPSKSASCCENYVDCSRFSGNGVSWPCALISVGIDSQGFVPFRSRPTHAHYADVGKWYYKAVVAADVNLLYINSRNRVPKFGSSTIFL